MGGTISTCATSQADRQKFFSYDSGRWLWNEEEQLRSRYRQSNIEALQRAAARAVGASACISMEKLNEGNFNKVFRLKMNNGAITIARIPNPNAGPAKLTTCSEVATMDFARTVLDIPVPKILAWCAGPGNGVEAEYIIMEEAPGTQLAEAWKAMTIREKDKVVSDLVSVQSRIMALTFTHYGALYYAHDAPNGSVEAVVSSDIPNTMKEAIRKRFVIGPVVSQEFWNAQRAHMDIKRGPWATPESYLRSTADREINFLQCHAVAEELDHQACSVSMMPAVRAQQDVAAHIDLYRRLVKVIPHLLPPDKHRIQATLYHWDLRAVNMFVQDGHISSVIDWQDVWAGPLCLVARTPGLVDYTGEQMLKAPEEFYEIEDEEEKQRILNKVERTLLLFFYMQRIQKKIPLLAESFTAPHSQTLLDLRAYLPSSWDTGIVPLRQCLVQVWRNWDRIAPAGTPCPIHFTNEELDRHVEQGESFNTTADFLDGVKGLISSSGWVALEDYDEVIEILQDGDEDGVETAEREDKDEDSEQLTEGTTAPAEAGR